MAHITKRAVVQYVLENAQLNNDGHYITRAALDAFVKQTGAGIDQIYDIMTKGTSPTLTTREAFLEQENIALNSEAFERETSPKADSATPKTAKPLTTAALAAANIEGSDAQLALQLLAHQRITEVPPHPIKKTPRQFLILASEVRVISRTHAAPQEWTAKILEKGWLGAALPEDSNGRIYYPMNIEELEKVSGAKWEQAQELEVNTTPTHKVAETFSTKPINVKQQR